MLASDFHFLQLAQMAQAHVENCVGLHLVELERLDQFGLGIVLFADDADHLVQIQIGDQVAFEDFQSILDLAETEGLAAHQHVLAVIEIGLQDFAEVHHPRNPTMVENIHVERKPGLEIGLSEQRFHQHRRVDIAALRLQHEADLFRRLIADIVQHGELALVQQLGDLLDQLRLLHLIGHLGNYDAVCTALEMLGLPFGADSKTAPPCTIRRDHVRPVLAQHAAGRKIRTRNEFDQFLERRIRATAVAQRLHHLQQRIAEFGDIMRRNAGRHADGNARGAIRQEIGEIRR